jgi:tetratricopeptide (TPR) repeat protein
MTRAMSHMAREDGGGAVTSTGEDIGTRLRSMRTARAMTQRELAGDRYTTAYVSSIEAGRRQPSADAIEYLAGQLGIDVEELRDGRPSTATLELRLAEARRLSSMGDAAQGRSEIEAVRALAEQHGLRRLHAQALVALGFWTLRSGNPRGGLGYYEQAERLMRDEPDPTRAAAVAGQARCLRVLGDVRRAVLIIERELESLDRAGLPDPMALMVLNAYAVASYQDLGLPARALKAAETALHLAPQVDDPQQRADMYRAVARGFLQSNRVDEARTAVARATELYDQLEMRTDVGHCHWTRGWVFGHGNKPDLPAACKALDQARDVFIETQSRYDEALVTIELADIVRRLGEFDRARDLIHGVEDYPELVNSPAAYAESERCLGLIAVGEDDPDTALHRLERAIKLFHQAEELLEEARTYRYLGDLKYGNDDPDGARRAYRRGLLALDGAS